LQAPVFGDSIVEKANATAEDSFGWTRRFGTRSRSRNRSSGAAADGFAVATAAVEIVFGSTAFAPAVGSAFFAPKTGDPGETEPRRKFMWLLILFWFS